jgi:hypothetical protein
VYPFGHAVHDEDPAVAEYVPTGHFVHVLLFAGEYVPAGQVSHTAYNITSCDIFHVIFVLLPTVHDSPVPLFFVFHPFCTLPDFLHTDDVNVKGSPYIGVCVVCGVFPPLQSNITLYCVPCHDGSNVTSPVIYFLLTVSLSIFLLFSSNPSLSPFIILYPL